MIAGLLISFTPVFSAEVAAVQKGMVLSLEDCIEIALKNSPNIKKSRYNYRLSKTDVNIAKSDFFPTLSLSTGLNYNDSKSRLRDYNNITTIIMLRHL